MRIEQTRRLRFALVSYAMLAVFNAAADAQEQSSRVAIHVDCARVEHRMAGGIGASWHAISKEIPVEPDNTKWRVASIGARGSAWGGNPPVEWTDSWEQVCRHASWLGMNWIRVELSQRMYEPERKRFDWTNVEMQALYRILDWCEKNKADVFLQQMWSFVDWNAIEGIHPLQSAPKSVEDFAEGVATLVDHLVREKGYTCIRWLCIVNEPNHRPGWWLKAYKEPASIMPALIAVREALDRRGLNVPLSAPDWSVPETGLTDSFDVNNADIKLGAYDVHNYAGAKPERVAQLAEWVKLAKNRGIPFFLSEMGNMRLGWRDRNPGPKSYAAVLSNAEMVLRGIQIGIDAFNRWSFTNRGDLDGQWQLVRTWDIDKRHYIRNVEPEPVPYYGWGILTRFNARYSEVLKTEVDSCEEVVSAALRSPNGNLTLYVLNQGEDRRDAIINFSGLDRPRTLYRYQVTEPEVEKPGFRLDPQGEINLSTGTGSFSDNLPPKSIIVFSTYKLSHMDPGITGE